MSSAIERNRTHRKEKKSIEPNRTFDFRTRDLCKTDVENPLPDLRSSSYFSPECSARVFRKRRNSAEMASDALWIVSFKCIVKGYQECRFDVKDGKVFMFSIMAVRCSQTSNILTLVHLLLSCSLLIVQDEFERIMYIVSKIFFIIVSITKCLNMIGS